MKRLSIQMKLFCAFGGLAILTMIILGTAIYVNAKSTYSESTKSSIYSSVRSIYNTIDVAYKMSTQTQKNNVRAASNVLSKATIDYEKKLPLML